MIWRKICEKTVAVNFRNFHTVSTEQEIYSHLKNISWIDFEVKTLFPAAASRNWTKSISRKIWMAENSWNFHTVSHWKNISWNQLFSKDLVFTKFLPNVRVNFLNFLTVFFTVWKFQDFSVTQILREINFGEVEVVKLSL